MGILDLFKKKAHNDSSMTDTDNSVPPAQVAPQALPTDESPPYMAADMSPEELARRKAEFAQSIQDSKAQNV